MFQTAFSDLGDLAPTCCRDRALAPPRTADGKTSLAFVLRQFDKALARALPRLAEPERWRRLVFVTSLLFQVSVIEPFMREVDESFALSNELDALRESMKRFAVAGLLAPAPRRRAALRRKR